MWHDVKKRPDELMHRSLNENDIIKSAKEIAALLNKLMNLYLTENNIAEMPELLHSGFLNRLPEHLKPKSLEFEQSKDIEEETANFHVRLTQLLDAGITKRGMSVRIKLKRDLAKKRGREYINSLEISATGTIVHDGQEFDKPSPLAAKINGSSCNGWEYIEIKKDGCWVRLEELRAIWRKTND